MKPCLYCHSNEHDSGEHRSGLDPHPELILRPWDFTASMDIYKERRITRLGHQYGGPRVDQRMEIDYDRPRNSR